MVSKIPESRMFDLYLVLMYFFLSKDLQATIGHRLYGYGIDLCIAFRLPDIMMMNFITVAGQSEGVDTVLAGKI